MIAETQQLANYQSAFGGFINDAPRRKWPWLQRLRENAFARFCETGFPTSQMEDWRFTNVSAIAHAEFELAAGSGLVSRAQIAAHGLEDVACRLVFVNGRFAPEHSLLERLPDALLVRNLAKQILEAPETIEPYLGRYLNVDRDAFCALNSAFLDDGAYIHLRRGAIVNATVYLLFVSVGDGRPTMNHPRNLIIAEDESQLTVVEDYVSVGGGSATLSNAATELIVGNDAVVSHYRIERESLQGFHVSTLRIQQGRDANVASHSLLVGGRLVRNNVHPILAGDGGDCLVNGLFLGKGSQHLDNYMLVEHLSPHCGSRQFYNGILDDQAHGVFHGRIIVHKEAQKTDAKQTNRNLLLSDDAQIDTKPQLEILADDVKCTHGATIGQIEDQALFYLRTRGIDEVSARQILLLAFASECTERMKESAVRAFVQPLIESHVSQMAHMSREATGAARPQREGELQ